MRFFKKKRKRKKKNGVSMERVPLSRFRCCSHGDSCRVYSALIINRLLYAALERDDYFFLNSHYASFLAARRRGGRERTDLSEHSAGALHLLASLCPGSYAALPRPLFILRGCLPGYVPWYASVGGPPRATCRFRGIIRARRSNRSLTSRCTRLFARSPSVSRMRQSGLNLHRVTWL